MTTPWKAWEGLTVDGVFPLLRFIGTGSRRASEPPTIVFETEYREHGTQRAAIKFVPAGRKDTSEILHNWQAASALTHPSILQILAGGESRIDDADYIYVVTELAHESLAEVLRERKLTGQEAREMLSPVVSALIYLHGKGFVHGHVKPSNILAVGNQLKITVDDVSRSPGPGTEAAVASSVASIGQDIRSVGELLREVLPEPLAEPFREIAAGCMDMSAQWSLDRVAARLRKGTARPSAEKGNQRESSQAEINPALWIGGGGFALLVILILVLWLGSDLFHAEDYVNTSTPAKEPVAAVSGEKTPAATASQTVRTKETENKASKDSQVSVQEPDRPRVEGLVTTPVPSASIVKRVLPDIPRRSRDTINGKVTVSVRVEVDPSGNVTQVTPAEELGSKYFTKFVVESAREWKFEPQESPRTLLLRFQLRRTETEVSVGAVAN